MKLSIKSSKIFEGHVFLENRKKDWEIPQNHVYRQKVAQSARKPRLRNQ
jgi:hypothetical protein